MPGDGASTTEPRKGPYWPTEKAADYTGYTPRHLRKLADQGLVAHIRIGRTYRFTRDDLDTWMASRRVEAAL